jgi:hypothetical protein
MEIGGASIHDCGEEEGKVGCGYAHELYYLLIAYILN